MTPFASLSFRVRLFSFLAKPYSVIIRDLPSELSMFELVFIDPGVDCNSFAFINGPPTIKNPANPKKVQHLHYPILNQY